MMNCWAHLTVWLTGADFPMVKQSLSQGSVAVSHKVYSSSLRPCSRFPGTYVVILSLLFAISFTLCLSHHWFRRTTGSAQLFVPEAEQLALSHGSAPAEICQPPYHPSLEQSSLVWNVIFQRSKEISQALCFPSVLGDIRCSNLLLIFKVITG